MKMTRFTAFILALLLACSSLTLFSCGKEPSPDPKDPVTPSDNQPNTPDTPDEPDEPTEPDEPEEPTVVRYFDDTKFHIATYYMGPKTEENLKNVKNAGIDLVFDSGFSTEMLDLFHKNGMGVILSGVLPGWWGDNGQNGGRLHEFNSIDAYVNAAKNVIDHPAVWMVDCGDEPSALDAEYFGEVLTAVKETLPQYEAYINLYPGYASNNRDECNEEDGYNQLGSDTFYEYVEAYAKTVPCDYLCFDHYPCDDGHTLGPKQISHFYNDLETFCKLCNEYDKDLWVILQLGNKDPNPVFSIRENRLLWQAYVSMTFGATLISWACFYGGWFVNEAVDENGNKLPEYDKLKAADKKIRYIGDLIVDYDNVGTHFIGFADQTQASLSISFLYDDMIPAHNLESVFENDVVKNLASANGGSLLVGDMVARDGSDGIALMITDATDPCSEVGDNNEITFSVEGDRDVSVIVSGQKKATELTPDANGLYHVSIEHNLCALIMIK